MQNKEQLQQLKMNLDLKNTEAILSPEGNSIFSEGFILRKVSKFVTGTVEDAVVPIPVFFDVKTGKVLIKTLPKELQAEYEEQEG